jgi:hypothetical protein
VKLKAMGLSNEAAMSVIAEEIHTLIVERASRKPTVAREMRGHEKSE